MKNENLKFCWEQYIKLIDILITISTGSIIIISSIFISNDSKINHCYIIYLIFGFLLLLFGIIFLIVWRIISQALMEHELLKIEKENLITTKLIKKKRRYQLWKNISMWLSGILIFISWILLGIYLIYSKS